jgi:tRNA 5-methylaminomethyl-2-thiouridine biosynthesis bifunctional protein
VRAYPQVTPARLNEANPLHSLDYDDYYFSLKDPIAERQTVFIDGLDLVNRFKKLSDWSCFRIGETGFGAGLSFLLAAQCFLNHAPSNARLQWISSELHPLSRADLERLHHALNFPSEMIQLAEHLLLDWPIPVAGTHRRLFANGRVVLDLHFNDATAVFSNMPGTLDAWCLDGFSPGCNGALWTPELFQAIAEHSEHLAPISTYTAASKVRTGLTHVGFQIDKHAGFGGKRERLTGVFQGQPMAQPFAPGRQCYDGQEVVIIGGGLSGAWVAQGLARRGVSVRVFEREIPAFGASGNPQGVTYAKLSIEATPASQIQLQALTHLAYWLSDAPSWHPSGVLLLASTRDAEAHQAKLRDALGLQNMVLSPVDQHDASDIAGAQLASGGLLLEGGGWLQPKETVHWLLTHPRITVESYHHLERADYLANETQLTLKTNTGIRSHTSAWVIWANADEAAQFSDMPLSLRPVRGQVTFLKTAQTVLVPVCGDAYIAPASDGIATCGATYQPNVSDLSPRPEENHDNVRRAQSLFAAPMISGQMIAGQRVAIRASTPDYAPVVGQLADPASWRQDLQQLRSDATYQPTQPLSWIAGQYVSAGQGSRGTLTAPMTAEIVVSQIMGEISPVSEDVRNALAPDRFFRRGLIRGQDQT